VAKPDARPPIPLADIGSRTAHATVAAALRQAILSGQLTGGTRLVQAELAAQLGTSNTPVREAMRALEGEGLIRFDAYRGAVVHAPTRRELTEACELAFELEPLAMRKATERITREELASLRALIARMQELTDLAEYVGLNRNLHDQLHAAARSPRLATILGSLLNTLTLQAVVAVRAGRRGLRESDREHAAIVDALEARDGALVARLAVEHLQLTRDAVAGLFEADSA
jgi:DNA-binding GntR family transcriptional regulator